MGIRYYAYAFDAEHTDQAVRYPRSIVSSDPLADAWGMEPHTSIGIATFEQTSPRRDMLYLDKAWRLLQEITLATSPEPRPAYRIFEGNVSMHDRGWDPFVRTVRPEEIPLIDDDLRSLTDAEAEAILRRGGADDGRDVGYALQYLRAAREFVAAVSAEGRGMVYLIG